MESNYSRLERRKAYFAIYKKVKIKESIFKTFIRWFKVRFKDPYKYNLVYLAMNKKKSEYKWVDTVSQATSMHHNKANRIKNELLPQVLSIGMIKYNGKEWGLI